MSYDEDAWQEADARGRALLANYPGLVPEYVGPTVEQHKTAPLDKVFAAMDRNRQRRMNPLTAIFEEYPFSLEWEIYMREHCHRKDAIGSLYPVYLKGTLWFDIIRPRILERDSLRCFRCGSRYASVVHHASYHPFVMVGLADEWLYTLCRGCHDAVHDLNPDNHELWRRLHDWRGPIKHRKQRMPFGTHLPTTDQCAQWDQLSPDETAHLMFAASQDFA